MAVQNKFNKRTLLAGGIALLTFLVYLPALRNEFVYWDDNLYIFENAHIRSLDGSFFRWAFAGFHVSNWHPLTWISHAVDYAIWGLNPLGHHLTNIMLHAVNAGLVVLLVLQLLRVAREGSRDRSHSFLNDRTIMIAAGVTGLLFGIHPVHVESVAWVSERKDLLCALFFLLSIMAYVRAVRGAGAEAAGGRLPMRALLPALGLFVLALLSKPMAVTLPVVLLIIDWYPLNRIRNRQTLWHGVVEKIPFIILSIASSIVTVVAQRGGHSLVALEYVPLSSRVLVAIQALVGYLDKMVMPLNLVPLYPYPRQSSLWSIKYALAVGLVFVITLVCIVLAKKQKLWLSAWSYYVATLVPVLGIIQVGNQSMADRYAYLPSIAPFLVFGLCTAWLTDRLIRKERASIPAGMALIGMTLVLAVPLSYLTVQQAHVWRNSLTLWTRVIEKEPDRFPLAYNNRGMVFFQANDYGKAIADFDKAVALDPLYAKAYYNRGSVFYRKGDLTRAIADYRKTIFLDPRYYEAYYYLDQALIKARTVR